MIFPERWTDAVGLVPLLLMNSIFGVCRAVTLNPIEFSFLEEQAVKTVRPIRKSSEYLTDFMA